MLRYRLARSGRGGPGMPINFTFSVTHLCQSRCKTCHIWDLYLKHPEKYRDLLVRVMILERTSITTMLICQ